VALGTDTSGDYVSSLTGTANQVTVTGGTGESSTPVLSLPQDIASTSSPTFANVTISNTPTNSTHAATKGYVDTIAQGLDVKASVKAATTANITLSGTQTIDGVALSVDDRVLVKNQSTQADNGFYLVKSSTWQRTTDADAWDELIGAFVFVEQGTTLADTGWVCTVNAGGTLGSTAVTFSQFSGVGSYQPLDATLTALAAYNTNGFIVQTATDTFAGRSLAAGTGISITNTDGVSGNPSIAIDSTVATLTGSQTLTNKTLDAAIIDNAALMLHETSVSTPASGRIALYPKSDNKLYIKDSTGVETAVGTGSGGGVINYILNPDAESNTTGWATYADAAGTTPVDGTGGSPSVTWTRNTTTPLRGNADFAFAKDAANRQGQGVSYDFTISSVDKGRKLSVSFDYNSNTTNYSAGDILVYLYDVTNSILITPSSTSLPKNTGTLTVNFDSTTSTSYRLILHVSTTNATAYTLYFDNFQVGPGQIVQGAAVSNSVAYTPVLTFSGGTTISSQVSSSSYTRIGEQMLLQINEVFTTATATPTGVTISIPSNLTTGGVSGQRFYGSADCFNLLSDRAGSQVQAVQGGQTVDLVLRSGVTYSAVGVSRAIRADVLFNIAEWSGSGTVSLGAGAQVEYAAWNGTTTVYGPSGAAFPSITASAVDTVTNHTITWQYPKQAGDAIWLEINPTASDDSQWVSLGDSATDRNWTVSKFQMQSTGVAARYYGIGYRQGTSTTTTVEFGNAGMRPAAAGAYGSVGDNWTTAYRYRLCKLKPSSPVGFGKADSTSFGLVAPRRGPLVVTSANQATYFSSLPSGFSMTRGVFIYYQDQDLNHRLKFNLVGSMTSATSASFTWSSTAVVYKSGLEQAVTAWSGTSGSWSTGRVTGSVMNYYVSAASTYVSLSGDVELDSKPTWA